MAGKDEVRELILDKAIELFSKFGFKKTTMDDIAFSAGKGKSSIYYYFASKEDVFEAVADRTVSEMEGSIRKSVSEVNDPMEKLHAYIIKRLSLLKDMSERSPIIQYEYLSHFNLLEKIREKYNKYEVSLVEDILNKGVERGVFVISEIELTATAVVTALRGLEIPLLGKNIHNNFEDRVNGILNILFYGIAKR